MHQRLIYLKLILTMAIWGGAFVIGRVVAQTISPFTAGFARFATASVFLWFLLQLQKREISAA